MKINFDIAGNPENPTLVLAYRDGRKIGEIIAENIIVRGSMINPDEISFKVRKFLNEKKNNLWDKILDFKLVWYKEADLWFEIKVDINEANETVKNVSCTQLGQAELSQIMLYNIEINTENDIARDDYVIPTVLYNDNNTEASLLHRIMEKAKHYSIIHVDSTIATIQRTFAFDGISIYDAMQQIAEEIKCLFVFHSNSDKDGNIQRTISVYDMESNCIECGHRGEFTDKCPKCRSSVIIEGYGEDTTIFVTADELAENINFTTDVGSVKNCFKLEAGDDLMTATIRNCNPNGTDYIWYISDDLKEDMSQELVEKIESYDDIFEMYQNDYVADIDSSTLEKYNNLVKKYNVYNEDLQEISTPIKGYPALMTAIYNTIDLSLYLESTLMPDASMQDTNATEQAELLTQSNLSPVAVTDVSNISLATANSAVLSMAKVIIDKRYRVKVNESSLLNQIWTGNFVVTNYSDEEDAAISSQVSIVISDNYEYFVRQKLDKVIKDENIENLSITGLFKLDYDAFCDELKKYCLNSLVSFRDACQACIDILIEQGVADSQTWSGSDPNLYNDLYMPYYQKMKAIESETEIRQNELNLIEGVYDSDGVLIQSGLQTYLDNMRQKIQEQLNFQNYIGDELWFEFCTHRREDKYSNDNYISDGLNNLELFENALEFISVAKNEIFKSAELQHSISSSLKNLLVLPKFKILSEYFETGNWIRVLVDDRIYKLRLLEYEIDFDNIDSLSVDFSDVLKTANGESDQKSVMSKITSMATSYDSIQRQASQGNSARNTIEQWIADGLNSSLVQIQNNNNEDITLTKSGLLCRSYEDITQTYSPEQLKLTHNILAYTDNDWQSVKQAIGKHEYTIYDSEANNFINKIGYGMNADFVTAGVVSGSQIIGGDIYSDNYSTTDKTGSYLNLRDGTFSFGGGALRYEGGKLLISSPDVLTTNQVTEINEQYLKTTTVYAENLQINSANINGELTIGQLPSGVAKIGDIPTKVSQLTNDSGYQTETGVTTIVGGVVTTDYVNALNVIAGSVAAENISGTTIEGKSIVGGRLLIGDKDSTYAEITEDGVLSCRGADITGNIAIESGVSFSVNSGGTVQISAGNGEKSYINFGEAFSASSNGLSATYGNFDSLRVNGKDVLTNDSLAAKVVISKTEPIGNGIIWICPSSVSNVGYSGYTADSRDWTLNISYGTKTFGLSCDSSDTLSGGTYAYKIKFPVYLVGGSSENGDEYRQDSNVKFRIVATKSTDPDLSITFPEYTLASIKEWEQAYIEVSMETTTNLCADTGEINVSITTTSESGWLFMQKQSYIIMTVTDINSSVGVQPCTIYYKE